MKKTMLILVVMLVVLAANAFGAEPKETNKITGAYALVSVNGSKLPATVSHGDVKIKVHSGIFTINADGTCSSKIIFGPPSGDKSTRQVNATYTRTGSTLHMKWIGAGRTVGTIKGDTFTMNNEGMMFEYEKLTLASKRNLNGDFEGKTYVNDWGVKLPLMWQVGGKGALNYENDGQNGHIVLSNPDSNWVVAHTQKPPISLVNFGVTAGETATFSTDIIKLCGDGSASLKLEQYKHQGTTANGTLTKQVSPSESWSIHKIYFKIKPDTDSVVLVLVVDTKGSSYGFDNVTFAPIDARVDEEAAPVTDIPKETVVTEEKIPAPGYRPESDRSAAFLSSIGTCRMIVFPTIVRTKRTVNDGCNKASQQSILKHLTNKNFAEATAYMTELDLSRTDGANQWEFFESSMELMSEQVKQSNIETDYHLAMELILVPRPNDRLAVFGIHVYILDQAGDNAFSFLLNSHHQLFINAELHTENSSKESIEKLIANSTQVALQALGQQIQLAK